MSTRKSRCSAASIRCSPWTTSSARRTWATSRATSSKCSSPTSSTRSTPSSPASRSTSSIQTQFGVRARISSGSVPELDAFDDPAVALGAVAQYFEGFLVVRAIVRGQRLVHVVELGDHHPLLHALLMDRRRHAAHDEAAAGFLDGGRGELGVGLPFLLVGDLAVGDDEIALAHGAPPVSEVGRILARDAPFVKDATERARRVPSLE